MVATIAAFARTHALELYVEINLSCPNIVGRPPPAYDEAALREYFALLPAPPPIPVGVKTPPYTHAAQFAAFLDAAKAFPKTLSFVTATNTLGSALHLTRQPGGGYARTLESAAGTGVGGLAGESIHWLSLGNVDSLRRGLDEAGLEDVVVIGVGGVGDRDGMDRMVAVGAGAVEVGTALGREGVSVFEKILETHP